MTVLLVAAGAAVGAPLRYLLDRAVRSRNTDSVFPWGILAVNATGCLLLGLLTAVPVGASISAVLGSGFSGALTTYSAFSYETFRLVQDRAWLPATLNVTISLPAGLGAAYLGLVIGQAL